MPNRLVTAAGDLSQHGQTVEMRPTIKISLEGSKVGPCPGPPEGPEKHGGRWLLLSEYPRLQTQTACFLPDPNDTTSTTGYAVTEGSKLSVLHGKPSSACVPSGPRAAGALLPVITLSAGSVVVLTLQRTSRSRTTWRKLRRLDQKAGRGKAAEHPGTHVRRRWEMNSGETRGFHISGVFTVWGILEHRTDSTDARASCLFSTHPEGA